MRRRTFRPSEKRQNRFFKKCCRSGSLQNHQPFRPMGNAVFLRPRPGNSARSPFPEVFGQAEFPQRRAFSTEAAKCAGPPVCANDAGRLQDCVRLHFHRSMPRSRASPFAPGRINPHGHAPKCANGVSPRRRASYAVDCGATCSKNAYRHPRQYRRRQPYSRYAGFPRLIENRQRGERRLRHAPFQMTVLPCGVTLPTPLSIAALWFHHGFPLSEGSPCVFRFRNLPKQRPGHLRTSPIFGGSIWRQRPPVAVRFFASKNFPFAPRRHRSFAHSRGRDTPSSAAHRAGLCVTSPRIAKFGSGRF